MEGNKQLQADLHFVRNAIDRSESHKAAPGIHILWGVIVLIGFSLIDVRPNYVGTFWFVMTPLGMAASMMMGYRHAQRSGQLSRQVGTQYALHWAGVGTTILLASLMIPAGMLTGPGMGSVALLISAFGYYLAGIRFDRRLIWIAGLMTFGYVGVLFVSAVTWTIVGILGAIGLIALAFTGGTDSGRTSD